MKLASPATKKGKLFFGKNVSSGIEKLQLSDAGIKDATAKELSELSQFLIRHLSINGNHNAADVLAWFADQALHHRPSKEHWLVVTLTRVTLRSYWTELLVDKTSRLIAGQMLQPLLESKQS